MASLIIFLLWMIFISYLFLLFKQNNRVDPILIFIAYIYPIIIGYIMLDAKNSTFHSPEILLSIILFIIGSRLSHSQYLTGFKNINFPKLHLDENRTRFVSIIVFSISFYHVAAMGFPLFQESVEINRFNFTDSGFWGVPSRFFLNVMPLTIIFLTVKWYGDNKNKGWLTFFWILFLILSLISGFKGSILVGILIGVFTLSAAQKIRMRDFINFKFAIIIIFGILVALSISFLYKSREINSFTQSIIYLYNRITRDGAEAGYVVMNNEKFTGIDFIKNDIRYYAYKYTKKSIPEGLAPSDKIVSSFITKTPLDGKHFVVSVTTGLFPILKSDYGLWLGLIFHFLYGIVFGTFYQAVSIFIREKSFLNASILIYFMYIMMITIGNGNPVYWLINLIIGVIILLMVCAICTIIGHRRKI